MRDDCDVKLCQPLLIARPLWSVNGTWIA